MVSFSCEACGDTVKKAKLDQHKNRCYGASFTCLDCMLHFQGSEYRAHTTCMTEEQRYQGSTYKESTKKAKKVRVVEPEPEPEPEPAKKTKKTKKTRNMGPHVAYVEDVEDQFDSADEFEYDSDDDKSPAEGLPEAPTPPPAVEDGPNVFDFLVDSNTPTASAAGVAPGRQETRLVRYYDEDADEYLDPSGLMVDDDDALVQYGTGPVPTGGAFVTPAAKAPRRKTRDGEVKKDKKRKRLHVETGDQVMTDAPPVLHSGLTGGLSRLMKPMFPPSPDYSGGDAAADTPASPTKKSRHSKSRSSRAEGIGNNLLALVSGKTSKPKKRRVHKKRSAHAGVRKHSGGEEKPPKLLEFRGRAGSADSNGNDNGAANQMILYKPRGDLFLSLVNKGPESERGCSVNKALKRFHRERTAAGERRGKSSEEKELFRSLRMRRNERGEIVLFCLDDEA